MRVCILVLDSFGIGASIDAKDYGDEGANTFLHIHEFCKGNLKLPNLKRLGLYHAATASSCARFKNISLENSPQGYYGYAVEQSKGKDTPSGHWELAGCPVMFDWGYFPHKIPCFPEEWMKEWLKKTNLSGVLAEEHGSGTELINKYGEEHLKTNMPIVYTSADSVFQVAAHEEAFGLNRLYEICEEARILWDKYADKMQIGRVIARPFLGSTPNDFKRTGNRRDYSIPPSKLTLLDYLKSAKREVIAIGKINDIFAGRGPTQVIKAEGNMALFDKTLEALKTAPDGSLIFTNFVDFDSLYGHRRDVLGYARALEEFDARLIELESSLKPKDRVLITADHGCDPTRPGSDHTREHVPVLMFGKEVESKFIGRRDSFSDMGQSIASFLGVGPLEHGIAF